MRENQAKFVYSFDLSKNVISLSENNNLIIMEANKLVRDKLVLQPKYFPTPFKDLINWDEMKHIKKPID